MLKYEIQISEPWDFSHPNETNVFTSLGIGVILGANKPNWGKEFFLINVEEPFEMDGELVNQLVCSPRYQGDTMSMVLDGECIVGLARVKQGTTLNAKSVVIPNEVEYCAIGSIKQAI